MSKTMQRETTHIMRNGQTYEYATLNGQWLLLRQRDDVMYGMFRTKHDAWIALTDGMLDSYRMEEKS